MKEEVRIEIAAPQKAAAAHSRLVIEVARWISILAHPFVMGLLTVGVAAVQRAPTRAAVRMVAVVLLFAVVPALALTFYQVRRGAWKNVDASNKHERPVLYGMGIVISIVLLGWFTIVSPNHFLRRGLLATLGMIVVCAVITRWSKVSLHMAFAAFAATAVILNGAVTGWIIAGVIPGLAWSRLVLTRHTWTEVVLGGLIGAGAGLAIHFA